MNKRRKKITIVTMIIIIIRIIKNEKMRMIIGVLENKKLNKIK